MPKFDKTLISIALVLFLILIIMLGYIFVKGLLSSQTNGTNEAVLNINKDKVIENPTERDLQNLLDKIKEKNDFFLKNVEKNKEDLE